MKDLKAACHVALVQASPVLFDKDACVAKVVEDIKTAARDGADLIVFPELMIPGYPYGMTFGYTVGSRGEEGRKDWKLYYDASILVPGKEMERIGEAARAAHAYVSLGISERDPVSATLYNSNVIFSPEGEIVSLHRKLKPTGAERMVWGDAPDHFFPVVDTPWGPLGSMICWENYMPLARTALYQKGVTLYIAPNTNDNEEWQATVRHIALEGRCFVLNCDMTFTKDAYPGSLHCPDEIAALPEIVCRGGSGIIDPYGHYVAGPIWDKEEILHAVLDMDMVPASRMEFDPCGHYSRPDVLDLQVKDR